MKVLVWRNPYRNFRFVDKDPTIDAQRMIFRDEGLTEYEAAQITGCAAATYKGWFRGGTRRPNNATLTQTAAALGYVRRDELRPDGTVVVGYRKARTIDPVVERGKMADWILKHGSPKKKKRAKRKTNGNGAGA